MLRIDIEPRGRFATALKQAIEERSMSLTDIAQRVDATYENLRKMISGVSYPSTHLLRALATELKADREEWIELIEADKLFKKYKKLPKFLNAPPEWEPFQAMIPKLLPEQREALLSMAKTFARQNTHK